MKPRTPEHTRIAYVSAINKLLPLGWLPVGIFIFEKDGKRYDLSAADLSQIERIEREGLFVIA